MTLRQIDALVAEKVMEWTPRGLHPIHECPVFATGNSDTFAPYFSTDIAAAWRVVEKLRMSVYPSVSSARWTAQPMETPSRPISGDTAPLSICLSALHHKGIRHIEVTE